MAALAQPLRLLDLFRYFKGEPHQMAAITELEAVITKKNPHILGRDQGWYKTWTQAGKTPEPAWLAPCLGLIREFEGCQLIAYKCPAGVWTIGWGTTRLIDRPVQEGDMIPQQLADELLRNEVEIKARGVLQLLPLAKDWSGHRIAALVSWAYNVGLGAVEDSTLRRRLLDLEDPAVAVLEELPRWNKANGRELPGLSRRRAAEVKLFLGSAPAQLSAESEAEVLPARLSPKAAFTLHLTPHIRLGEFALDQPERRFQYQHQVDTAAELACFLERVREAFGGQPVIITSGYRPPAINKACGGAAHSEHLYAVQREGAVDFYVDGADINAVQSFCDQHWPHSLGYGAQRGFVHLGRRASGERRRWDY